MPAIGHNRPYRQQKDRIAIVRFTRYCGHRPLTARGVEIPKAAAQSLSMPRTRRPSAAHNVELALPTHSCPSPRRPECQQRSAKRPVTSGKFRGARATRIGCRSAVVRVGRQPKAGARGIESGSHKAAFNASAPARVMSATNTGAIHFAAKKMGAQLSPHCSIPLTYCKRAPSAAMRLRCHSLSCQEPAALVICAVSGLK